MRDGLYEDSATSESTQEYGAICIQRESVLLDKIYALVGNVCDHFWGFSQMVLNHDIKENVIRVVNFDDEW
jgi:hypothetical protein